MTKALLMLLALGALAPQSLGAAAGLDTVSLPPLQVRGQAADAHTQGLEIVDGQFFVTARLESVRPKQAILVRTTPQSVGWDLWDITPAPVPGASALLDHPGGFQSDGKRLWIPVSESVRHGRTVIRVFALDRLRPGEAATADFEFAVTDHIGALAVWPSRRMVVGASWDTETVYVWNLEGRLEKTLTGLELESRGLGIVRGSGGRTGLAVQDWKISGDRLYASGLRDDSGRMVPPARSRLNVFTRFLDPDFESKPIDLPAESPTELAREGMAIWGGAVYYLPENLTSSNRCFRIRPSLPSQSAGPPGGRSHGRTDGAL